MSIEVFVVIIIAVVLALTIINDLRRMRIPNVLTLILIAMFPLYAISFPDWATVFTSVGFATLVFAACFIAFGFRLMGGGDVKILGALALFAPLSYLPEIMFAFSGSIILTTAFVLIVRPLIGSDSTEWKYLASPKFPLGLPIGMAGLIVVFASLT